MIKLIQLNLIKIKEWDISLECGGLMSGLMLMALQDDSLFVKNENIFYKTSINVLFKAFPSFKLSTNIIKYLKVLEKKSLIELDIEEYSINFMFTEKGATWLVYDLAYSKKLEEALNG